MDFFATLNFCNQTAPRFSKGPQSISEKVLPPLMLPAACSRWTLAGADTNEHANLSTRPLVDSRFLQDLRCRIICACAFIDEDMLSDLNRLKS